jgi:hypothetical protein
LASPVPQTPEREHARSHSESAASTTSRSPVSPLSPRARLHHHHSGQYSHGGTLPLSSPPASVPAPVFSIGLSPASPGFSLVPRERRRCISGQSIDPWDEAVRHVRTRRIVSDTSALAGGEVERGREEAEAGEDEAGWTSRARGRWKRLRGLIVR